LLPNGSVNSINGTWSPAVVNNANNGIYTFTPGTSECAVPTTFTVTVTPRTLPIFSFGTSLTICSGDAVPALLNLSSNSINGTWTPASINNLTSGTYTFTPDLVECATTTTLSVTVTSPILIELSGGCQSIQYVLTATPLNGSFDPETATYLWQNTLGVDVGTNQSLDVPEAGSYTVTVTSNGCSIVSIPFVVESVACQIQKGISVNNDGLNDTFDLTGFNVKTLIIFNRLGMQVYSRSDYTDQWGGKSDDGDELPDGTYFYNIEQRSGEVRTGWIYINRAQ
jgi:gliding motility-associated-like protein